VGKEKSRASQGRTASSSASQPCKELNRVKSWKKVSYELGEAKEGGEGVKRSICILTAGGSEGCHAKGKVKVSIALYTLWQMTGEGETRRGFNSAKERMPKCTLFRFGVRCEARKESRRARR